mgnify:FL=1
MKPSEMLNEVKTLLGLEIKLEQMKLENGTVLEADKFEAGNEIFIVTEDEKVALPIGDYTLDSGEILVVSEEGIIAEIKKVDEEKVDEVEVAAEEVVEEEVAKDEKSEFATKDELNKVIAMIEEIKAMLETKEELTEEVGDGALKSRTVKEEFSEVPEEVKSELSEPAAEPINTSASIGKTEVKFKVSSKRGQSTLDRVMNKLNK